MEMEYSEFLREKEIINVPSGFTPTKINPMLFDFQKEITKWAIRRGRAAIFADCGLGKTPIQLEWARQIQKKTKKPILILAPLTVSKQTKREGEKFNTPVNICESQGDIINGINITNYEKIHKFDAGVFSGVVLDESSILKSYTGKFRNFIIDQFARTPYKLACTATPAPNDFMELGNHSEFLNILTRSEMLSMFFINDTANIGTWRLKGHGEDQFWNWLCSWAVMLSKPSDLGFDDDGFILPELKMHEHIIKSGKPANGELFIQKAETLNERRAARRNSVTEKIALLKTLIKKDETWLIWCDLNRESEAVAKEIEMAKEITGSQEDSIKEQNLLGFINKEFPILVTKSKIAGFGLNLQHCNNVAFMGLSDSYESFYQAIRRCWRFGQTRNVHCHVLTTDVEGNVLENVKRKEADSQKMRDKMIKNTMNISKQELKTTSDSTFIYKKNTYKSDKYELHLGDNIDCIKKIEDETVGFSIFSPPFASLFTYTNSIRDMGNCKNKDDFLNHFKFLVTELYRVLQPGRLVAIHCMNLPATITHDGYMGLHDFRGDLIYMFQNIFSKEEMEKENKPKGFIFHSEICIWKDPLIQAVRTKALTLAHKQVVKDSSRCGQGLADYIIVMRKPGENQNPIERKQGFSEYAGERLLTNAEFNTDQRKNKKSHGIWQRYASPVWMDIRQTRVLNTEIAKTNKDEKHVCPLQLDTIERCLELWSTKGDIVLDPFNGIGSVTYSAVLMGRYGIGMELKESYWKQSIKNMKQMQDSTKGFFE